MGIIVGYPSTTPSRIVGTSKCPAENAPNPKNPPKNTSFGIDFGTKICKWHSRRITININTIDFSDYYYFPHVTKQDYNRAFNTARLDVLKTPELLPATASKKYYVKENSLRKLVLRSKQKQRNSNGFYNTHSRNNKILSDTQEEAIRQYCYKQWEASLGATYQIVFAAITHLRAIRSLPHFIAWLISLGTISSLRASF